MAQYITFNLGDNKDATVEIQTIPAVRLTVKLKHTPCCEGCLYLDINFCYSIGNIYQEITYMRIHPGSPDPSDVKFINTLITGMKNNINVTKHWKNVRWSADIMYWLQLLYTPEKSGGDTTLSISLCEESKEQFIDELQGLIHILKTIKNKGDLSYRGNFQPR